MRTINWINATDGTPKQYTCAHCGCLVGPSLGYRGMDPRNAHRVVRQILICSNCEAPTYFAEDDAQHPQPAYGRQVNHLEENVNSLYNEARAAFSVKAYTSSVMACRKLLMHIAVGKGAKAGDSFLHYIEFLRDSHYIPPGGADWVDRIRQKGNEANHEIVLIGEADAKQMIGFSEMLLKFVFEFPRAIAQPTG